MPRVEIVSGVRAGESVDLLPGGILGTAPTAEVQIDGAGVAPEHARLDSASGGFLIVDLGSASGTYINGERLAPQGSCPVRAGDQILLGAIQLKFEEERAKAFPRTQVLGGLVTFGDASAPEADADDEDDAEEEGEEPTFDRTIFVAPPDEPEPEDASQSAPSAPRTKRLNAPTEGAAPTWNPTIEMQSLSEADLAETPTADPPSVAPVPTAAAPPSVAPVPAAAAPTASPVAAGPSHEELEAALQQIRLEIEDARSTSRRQMKQAREALKNGQRRFQQAAVQQRQLLDHARAAMRARDEQLQAERTARGQLQAQLAALQAGAAAGQSQSSPSELQESRADVEELRGQLDELNEDLISISDERDAMAAELEKLRGGAKI